MWLTMRSPTRHVRDAVEDVAIPPWTSATRGSLPWRTSASLTEIAQGPPVLRRARRHRRRVPRHAPEGATSSAMRSATSALALAPRSSWTRRVKRDGVLVESRWIDDGPIDGTDASSRIESPWASSSKSRS